MTTLYDACRNGDLAEVNRLLAQGENAAAGDSAAFRMAAVYGYLDIVNRLLAEPGVDAAANINEAIRMAAQNGHLGVVNRLLEVPGVDATAGNNLTIRFAASHGHLEVVNRLLAVPGVDATANNNSAIRGAAYYGHWAIVELITETLRLQILADFYTAYRNEPLKEEEKSLGIDFLDVNQQLKFKNAVLKRMGNITDIETIIEEKIIQKTFIQHRKQIFLEDVLPKTTLVDILSLISDYDEGLNPSEPINHFVKEEQKEAPADTPLENTETNIKKENLISGLNKKLNELHLMQYRYLTKTSKNPSFEMENQEANKFKAF
ncbi:MAG: ankyrin [Francisellaceae bacterium]|nr:ankyrin [Francisellaceae bacterium]